MGSLKDKFNEKRGKLIEAGYDQIAESYHAARRQFDVTGELDAFMALLPGRGRVLDAGCGAGVPVCKTLVAKGFRVTGIDISDGMLALAKENVPQADFLKKDMTKLDFPEDSFDGITAFYSIIHVPRERHAALFGSFRRILKPGGAILACMGAREWEGEGELMGAPLYWSHYSPDRSTRLITDAGFNVLSARFFDHGDGEEFLWVCARTTKGLKSSSPSSWKTV